MSKKLIKDNPDNDKQNEEKMNPEFSFLELDKYLTNENYSSSNNQSVIKSNKKTKKPISKEPENYPQKLRIKPNSNLAKNQTPDDLIYEENKNIPENIPEKIPEKEVIKNPEPKKEKKDRRIRTINLEKEKKIPEEKKNLEDEKKEIENNENIDTKKYDLDTLINNIKQKDPKALVPIMLPFEKEDLKKEKSLKEELLEENKLFIFQFPRQIPINNLNCQIKTKEEENVNEEPNYDENGYLISPEFKNSFQEIKDNNVKIGKLILLKNGKIKLKMGDIYFDINQGSKAKFAQETVVVQNEENQAYFIGEPVNKKFIVTPEFE